VHARLEVAIAREHAGGDEIIPGDGLLDRRGERVGVRPEQMDGAEEVDRAVLPGDAPEHVPRGGVDADARRVHASRTVVEELRLRLAERRAENDGAQGERGGADERQRGARGSAREGQGREHAGLRGGGSDGAARHGAAALRRSAYERIPRPTKDESANGPTARRME
jgi:hypothetical protein